MNANTTLFVAGIPFSMDSTQLHDLFATKGNVIKADVITDPSHQHRSRGYGFVEMATDVDTQNAISMLHDTELNGRKIIVKFKEIK